MRAVIGNRALERAGAGETTVGRFEKEILLEEDNRTGLDEILKKWTEKIDSVRGIKENKTRFLNSGTCVSKRSEIILDIDSSESPVYGEQEGSNYSGHFLSRCYHPLFVFNQHGDCLKVKLRPGNAHSADGWEEFLEPVLRHYAGKGISIKVRGDVAFAIPGLYELCEELRIDYAVRIKENKKIAEKLEEYTKKPVERPVNKPMIKYVNFRYRAGTWKKERRIVAKIEQHPGELFARIGYIATSLKQGNKQIVKYLQQGGLRAVDKGRETCP